MALAPATVDVQARTQTVAATTPTEAAVSVTAAHQIVITVNQLVNRSPMTLTASIEELLAASGGAPGVAPMGLGGAPPPAPSYRGGAGFLAAPTHKPSALLVGGGNTAAGAARPHRLG